MPLKTKDTWPGLLAGTDERARHLQIGGGLLYLVFSQNNAPTGDLRPRIGARQFGSVEEPPFEVTRLRSRDAGFA